jgi:DNA-binding CsgD family transcriptional regulator
MDDMTDQDNLLTEKQKQALEMVADHLSSKEIAQRLIISSHSVDKRLDEARRRLGATTRKEAVRLFADRNRKVPAGDWFTGEPITVSETSPNNQTNEDERNEALYAFADVAPMERPMPWRGWADAVPELKPDRLSSGARLGLILAGAVGLVVLVLLLLALAQGIQSLL